MLLGDMTIISRERFFFSFLMRAPVRSHQRVSTDDQSGSLAAIADARDHSRSGNFPRQPTRVSWLARLHSPD
jgi:hypothetical protein